jgi:hypothetical protein
MHVKIVGYIYGRYTHMVDMHVTPLQRLKPMFIIHA